ncbi:MAG: hypothetical protein KW806_00490 [Candidatus Yanofskybacteria bacterium]|nr:hypothetical protein [Candidatus Yanofskybacteria bacterium]
MIKAFSAGPEINLRAFLFVIMWYNILELEEMMSRPEWAVEHMKIEKQALQQIERPMGILLTRPVTVFWQDPEDPRNTAIFTTIPSLVESHWEGVHLHFHQMQEMLIKEGQKPRRTPALVPLRLNYHFEEKQWILCYLLGETPDDMPYYEAEVHVEFL